MSGYDNIDRFRPPKVISRKKEDDPETAALKAKNRPQGSVVLRSRTIEDVERELRQLDEDCHGGKEPPAARLLRKRLKDPEFRAVYERRMAEEVRG